MPPGTRSRLALIGIDMCGPPSVHHVPDRPDRPGIPRKVQRMRVSCKMRKPRTEGPAAGTVAGLPAPWPEGRAAANSGRGRHRWRSEGGRASADAPSTPGHGPAVPALPHEVGSERGPNRLACKGSAEASADGPATSRLQWANHRRRGPVRSATGDSWPAFLSELRESRNALPPWGCRVHGAMPLLAKRGIRFQPVRGGAFCLPARVASTHR